MRKVGLGRTGRSGAERWIFGRQVSGSMGVIIIY